ncbi:MAG: hypothetical protein M0Z40_13790, partial [Actinomycetota bacterium]|nr:hypothetical protein [Actinomycetota bacterium]
VVVVDNGGGGIFSFLSQADGVAPEMFDRLFTTPQMLDIGQVASGLGVEVVEVSTTAELAEALADASSTPRVVRVRVPAARQNVVLHDDLHQTVARSLCQALHLQRE